MIAIKVSYVIRTDKLSGRRCICSAQTNFIKTQIYILKIEILRKKNRKNTVFLYIKNEIL